MKILLLILVSFVLVGCGIIKKEPVDPNESVAVMSEDHGYADYYTQERLSTLQFSGKRFAIFVGADWCPGCKRLTKEILANQSSLPSQTAILTADFDTELELRRAYGVAVKHTGVFFDEAGELVAVKPAVVFQDFMSYLSGSEIQ